MTRPRLFFHVQHLLGVGHRVRARAIAEACVEAGFHVDLADGGAAGGDPPPAGVQHHTLPEASAANASFGGIVDAHGAAIDDAWKAARRDRLLALFSRCRPDILLIEGFPFARRGFRFELLPLLDTARTAGIPVAVSVRDVIQPKQPERLPEVLDWLHRYVDLVLVHGDPDFISFSASFPPAGEMAPGLIHTGYVSAPFTPKPDAARSGVVVSGGGGAVAEQLFDAALAAHSELHGKHGPWHLLVGPNHDEAHSETLFAAADGETLIVEPARADFRGLLESAAISVSQAGYNTVSDLICTGTPAILSPFESGGQREQRLRADRMARARRAVILPEEALSGANLAAAIPRAAGLNPDLCDAIAMDGAARTAHDLLELYQNREGRVHAG